MKLKKKQKKLRITEADSSGYWIFNPTYFLLKRIQILMETR